MPKKQQKSKKHEQQRAQRKKALRADTQNSPVSPSELGDIVGLVNLGNTCFFNAAVQVLLSARFIEEHFKQPGKRGPLGQGLHEIAKAASGQGDVAPKGSKSAKKRKLDFSSPAFTPRKLHSAVLKIAPHLKMGVEQDSHELMRHLMAGLQDEENETQQGLGSAPVQEATHAEEQGFVHGVFQAQLMSRIECLSCPYVSGKVEEFMDISIELPQEAEQTRIEPEGASKKKGKPFAVNESGKAKQDKKGAKISKQQKKEPKGAFERSLEEEMVAVTHDIQSRATAYSKQAYGNCKQTSWLEASPLLSKANVRVQTEKAADLKRKQQRDRSTQFALPDFGSEGETGPAQSTTILNRKSAGSKKPSLASVEEISPCKEEGGNLKNSPTVNHDGEGSCIHEKLTADGTDRNPNVCNSKQNGFSFDHQDSQENGAPEALSSTAETSSSQIQRAESGTGSKNGDGAFAARLTDEERKSVQSKQAPSRHELTSSEEMFSANSDLEAEPADSSPPADGYHPLSSGPKAAQAEPMQLLDAQTSLAKLGDAESRSTQVAGDSIGSCLESSSSLSTAKEKKGEIDSKYSDLWKERNEISSDAKPQAPEGADPQAFGCLFDAPEEHVGPNSVGSVSLPSSPKSAAAGLALEDCLAAFFAPEEVTWECPAERRKAVEESTSQPEEKKPSSGMKRNVSFSDQKPSIKFVPGSEEQRGTDAQKALEGKDSFRRSFKAGEAHLLVTVEVDSVSQKLLHIMLDPNATTNATLELLAQAIHITDVAIPDIKDSGNEEEQDRVAQTALLLINCIVDMVLLEGIQGMQEMVDPGIWLKPKEWPTSVCGSLSEKLGGGTWEYPLATPRTPAPGKAHFQREIYLSCQPDLPNEGAAVDSQQLEEPDTPAAASISSFETIDLEGSPVKRQCPSSGQSLRLAAGDRKEEATACASSGVHLSATLDAVSGMDDAVSNEDDKPLLENTAGDDCSGTPPACPSVSPSILAKNGIEQNSGAQQAAMDSHASSPCQSASETDGGAEDRGTSNQQSQASLSETFATPLKQIAVEDPSEDSSASKKGLRSGLRNPHRKAKKGYLIHRAPLLLTVHLKRFQLNARGKAKKINGAVSFGLQLDVSPWCDPKGLDADGAQYSLVGVVVHAGNSLQTGHYYAYVKRSTCRQSEAEQGSSVTDTEVPAQDASEAQQTSESGGGGGGKGGEHSQPTGQPKARPSQANEREEEVPGDGGASSSSVQSVSPKFVANSQGSWYYVSDRTVKAASVDEVLHAEAYILLYQRRNTKAEALVKWSLNE